MNFIKKVLLGLMILSISAGIFFLLVKDQQVKEDILRTSLEMFGNDLLAMVPDGEEKSLLVKKYQEFVNKADKNEIPEEEVERVIATTLNYRNLNTPLSADRALDILEVSSDTTTVIDDKKWGKFDRRQMTPPPPLDREELIKRLEQLNKFQNRLSELSQEDSTFLAIKRQTFYFPDSGLQAHVNIGMIPPEVRKSLKNEFKSFENKGVLKFYLPEESKKLAQLHFNQMMHYLPPEVREEIFSEEHWKDVVLDSLNFNPFWFSNPDSLGKFIEKAIEMGKSFGNFEIEKD